MYINETQRGHQCAQTKINIFFKLIHNLQINKYLLYFRAKLLLRHKIISNKVNENGCVIYY